MLLRNLFVTKNATQKLTLNFSKYLYVGIHLWIVDSEFSYWIAFITAEIQEVPMDHRERISIKGLFYHLGRKSKCNWATKSRKRRSISRFYGFLTLCYDTFTFVIFRPLLGFLCSPFIHSWYKSRIPALSANERIKKLNQTKVYKFRTWINQGSADISHVIGNISVLAERFIYIIFFLIIQN